MGIMKFRTRYQLPLVFAAALALIGCGDKQAPAASGMQMPPTAVEVVTLKTSNLELSDLLPGRVTAYRSAEIRPQVNGIITKRFFEEGATVAQGDKLYQIDPSLYQAQLANTQAQLAVAEANAYTAKLKAERYQELSKQSAISAQELDDSQAQAKQTEALVQSAQAAVRSAKVNLGYTLITAPISGVISRSTITEGSLVSAQQATALTLIRQLSPVYVDVQRPAAEIIGMKNSSTSKQVSLELDDGSVFAEQGQLQFTDVSVDPTTGTVNVRALFENKNGVLLPGMFVRAKVPSVQINDALLVPQKAIIRQANAVTVAMVVNAQNEVEMRVVQVSRAIGDQWLVKSGLQAGERVIVTGLQKVQPGSKVAPEEAAAATTTSAQQP